MIGPAGRLDAILDEPFGSHARSGQAPAIRAAVVFAHPHPQYGGTMHTKAVFQGAKGLVRIGCAVLRFNFRGVGRSAGTFDLGDGEKRGRNGAGDEAPAQWRPPVGVQGAPTIQERSGRNGAGDEAPAQWRPPVGVQGAPTILKDDFRSALDYMAARYPGVKLWAAGFSFGAWVALEVGADDDRVSVLIGIAPPVATSLSGHEYTFERTLASRKAKFFVQGEDDEVCPLAGLRAFYARLEEPRELAIIDSADHLFEGKTQEVGEALEDLLKDYEG
ncbi:MAG: hypothetical protein A3H96_18875 [Acidobacteria bacterium RIFCSPLOWO2_02_FULL_67_36]|nr:MAG: hypothetical protein A3H96_18875 [Acidobacteria bacterium RIFCSPLOWO2_02_FULL_67_36]OFW18907.1 MAG: hypothetical protein A3G21_04135 [Acidobacteria bacterium RIFCSPLOWO2_12_FULL_66_21]